jgi:hypothetical protein
MRLYWSVSELCCTFLFYSNLKGLFSCGGRGDHCVRHATFHSAFPSSRQFTGNLVCHCPLFAPTPHSSFSFRSTKISIKNICHWHWTFKPILPPAIHLFIRFNRNQFHGLLSFEVIGCGIDGPGIESRWGEIFCTPPDLWIPPPLSWAPPTYYSWYGVTFPVVKQRGVALTTHPYIAPRLKK